ncbi:hypothetical protein GF406_10950 [candidate division KSB1 bacterium]|nr:hypothetical protein [candidate division KSB1 bacterium]
MNNTTSIFLLSLLLIISIILLLYTFLKTKCKKSLIPKRLIIYKIVIVFLIIYGIFTYSKMLKLGIIYTFSRQIEDILISYSSINGNFPTSINQLNEFKPFIDSKKRKFIFTKPNFDLICNFTNGKYEYVFYSFGLDGDDDKLNPTYEPDLSYAFLPRKNGDIILKDGSLYLNSDSLNLQDMLHFPEIKH